MMKKETPIKAEQLLKILGEKWATWSCSRCMIVSQTVVCIKVRIQPTRFQIQSYSIQFELLQKQLVCHSQVNSPSQKQFLLHELLSLISLNLQLPQLEPTCARLTCRGDCFQSFEK